MSFFYDDILRTSDGHLGVDVYADPTRVDPFKKWTFAFKAAASKKVTIDHGLAKQYEWKDGQKVDSEKNATKVSINHGDCKTSWGFANDKFTFASAAKAYDEDDWKINTTASAEVKPAKNDWKVEGSAAIRSPDLGGARAFLNFGAEHNAKKEWIVKPKLNLQIQDEFHVGVSAEHDTKDFQKLFAQFVFNQKDGGNYWVRLNQKANELNAGCHHTHADKIHHSWEAVYGWKDFKGFQGHPVLFRFGAAYKLNESTNLQSTLSAGENTEAHQEVSHKIDNHWSVAAHQHFDSGKIGSKAGAYDLGFNVNYKL